MYFLFPPAPVSMYQIWKDMKPVAENLKSYLLQENVPSKSHITIIRTLLGIIFNVAIMTAGPAIDMEVYLYILLVCIVNMVLYVFNYVLTKVSLELLLLVVLLSGLLYYFFILFSYIYLED